MQASLGSLDPNVFPLDAIELSGDETSSERTIGLKSPWKWDSEDGTYPISGYVAGRGYWQKHADGTLVQWGSVTQTLNTIESNFFGSTSGILYYNNVTVTFPIAFVNNPNVVGDAITAIYWRAQSITENQFVSQPLGGVNGASVTSSWIAIGRWKA